MQIFFFKKLWEAAKASHIFSTKNISVFGYKIVKHLTSWPLNELVKLTKLWTNWALSSLFFTCHVWVLYRLFFHLMFRAECAIQLCRVPDHCLFTATTLGNHRKAFPLGRGDKKCKPKLGNHLHVTLGRILVIKQRFKCKPPYGNSSLKQILNRSINTFENLKVQLIQVPDIWFCINTTLAPFLTIIQGMTKFFKIRFIS